MSDDSNTTDYQWRPEVSLRFREMGERGMVLEQLFIGTAPGLPLRAEWRPVPVVPESQDV
jgi:hypothetical protein